MNAPLTPKERRQLFALQIDRPVAALNEGQEMSDLFRVVWASNGEPADDLEGIALNCEWAKGLMYCDMQGFAVEPDGTLLLLDECGNHRYPPEGLFQEGREGR